MSWFWQPFEPDQAAAPAEPDIRAGFTARISFAPYRRRPDLGWNRAVEGPETPAEPDTFAPFFVRHAFKPLGRNPYAWNPARDVPPPPPEPDLFAPYLIRHPFRGYRPRPSLGWNRAIEGPEQRNDVGSSIFIVRTWDGYRLTHVARLIYWNQARDIFVAPVETGQPPHLLLRHAFKPFGRNRYIFHRDYASAPPAVESTFAPFMVHPRWGKLGRNRYLWHTAHDESAPAITFNAAFARNANVLIKAGLLR